jgi:hypothetical protein
MNEIIINLHMHTFYSDGHASHAEIAQAALRAGIDAVIVTDHNVLVEGIEGYFEENDRRVLLLVGEEIHDQARQPQKNHLLVFGANKELAPLAYDTQFLIDSIRKAGGLSFIAHLYDPAAPAFGETDISWENWQVQGFTGIELWNSMSEFKSLLKSKLHAIYYVFNPQSIAHGPANQTLKKWDELLSKGRPIVAIGGSDAHAMPASLGPIKRVLFPYEFHFRCINTHLLSETPLTGDLDHDKRVIYAAIQQGQAFVGYDLPAPTRGFRFTAHGLEQKVIMGNSIELHNGVTLQIRLPQAAECRLLLNGEVIQTWQGQTTCTHITSQAGVYRVEVYRQFRGLRRGWIFSNPIYVRQPLSKSHYPKVHRTS